jgi:hypothetical protein
MTMIAGLMRYVFGFKPLRFLLYFGLKKPSKTPRNFVKAKLKCPLLG